MSDDHATLRRELEDARAEIADLRRAVVTTCDIYGANRAEKQRIKAYRLVAAKGPFPFALSTVEAELARIEQRDRDELEQLRATAGQLAADMTEALYAIEKEPGIDVALKTLRYVRDVLEQRSR